MFWFFRKKAEKRELEQLKKAVQTSFNNVKENINNLNSWIKHLDNNDSILKDRIFELEEEIASIREELEGIKNVISIISNKEVFKQLSKHKQPLFNKQTVFKGVLNSVQTAVQTAYLDKLSPMERAIIYILLNSDMKLSYEDLAVLLGKKKSTIRGQINNIKQKSEGLIEEVIEENNKKRVYIPDEIKEVLLKKRELKAKKLAKKKKSES